MLRTLESRDARVESGGRSPWAAPPSQSKRLTSFLIQDILRDRAERRGGHASSPQHQGQPDPRRDPEPEEPEEAGGRAVALGHPPNIRPSSAETPAEPETGKRNRLGGGTLRWSRLLRRWWSRALDAGIWRPWPQEGFHLPRHQATFGINL